MSSKMPRQNFFIFGQGIAFSKSPAIQTAAFSYHDLPHKYEIRESDAIADFKPFIESDDFGGANVTMPHKVDIMRYCDNITEHARLIGAVNTLVVSEQSLDGSASKQRNITGDNTDWSGLHTIIFNIFPSILLRDKVGLVVGSGGASRGALYALHKSGVQNIYLVNRTKSKADKIAKHFADTFSIVVLSSFGDMNSISPDIIIGTIPAHTTTEDQFSDLFVKPNGLCIDMSYKPRDTNLLRAASRHQGWTCVPGVEVLLYQGFDAFKLWTGLPAPEMVMRDALESSA